VGARADGIQLPMAPFLGVVAVESAADNAVSAIRLPRAGRLLTCWRLTNHPKSLVIMTLADEK